MLCHVLFDYARREGYYKTEPYCLEFCDETNDFILTIVTDRDGAAVKSHKISTEKRNHRGAVLMNEEGEFVGMVWWL